MGSFGILKGPMEHFKSMCAADRMYFSFLYIGSMMSTLYLTFTHGGVSGYLVSRNQETRVASFIAVLTHAVGTARHVCKCSTTSLLTVVSCVFPAGGYRWPSIRGERSGLHAATCNRRLR